MTTHPIIHKQHPLTEGPPAEGGVHGLDAPRAVDPHGLDAGPMQRLHEAVGRAVGLEVLACLGVLLLFWGVV
jgi:hypothetical protein